MTQSQGKYFRLVVRMTALSLALGTFFRAPGTQAHLRYSPGETTGRLRDGCRAWLESSRQPSNGLTPFQKKIWTYHAEVQKKRALFPFGQWERRVILKSEYVKEQLIKLNQTSHQLAETEKKKTESRSFLLQAADVLQRYTQTKIDRFSSKGLSYSDFLHLALLHQIQFEHFWFDQAARPKYQYPYDFIISNSSDIEAFLKKDKFEFSDSRRDFDFLSMDREKNWMIAIPTFATLSIKTILWAQSRGIGFLGLTTTAQDVDGLKLAPLTFFLHDLEHNRRLSWARNDSEFWDRLSARLEQSDSEREKRIKYGLVFLMFHESSLRPMTCKGATWEGKFDKPDNPDRLMNTATDLGYGFNPAPKMDEINRVMEKLALDLKAICPEHFTETQR